MRLKKKKLNLAPLPVTQCVEFRGFSGNIKKNMALTQSFATLFKIINHNYGNREVAWRMGLVEEISEIAMVCQGLPRILDYIIWIFDKMYLDGFGAEGEPRMGEDECVEKHTHLH